MGKLNIIYEDDVFLVLDKPGGLVVNRSQTVKEDTLQDQIGRYLGLADLGIGGRAGIVHRLDRETSGLIVVAKTQAAFENLQAQFKNRQVEKEYIALVHGRINQSEGSIEARIERIGKFGKFGIAKRRSTEAREARTDFRVQGRYAMLEEVMTGFYPALQGGTLQKARVNYLKRHACDYSLLMVIPKTGRTHQIRVHLKSIGHPLVSDLIYGPHKIVSFDLTWCPRLFLHAAKLAFIHPKSGRRQEFESDLPNELKRAILNLDRLTTKV